MKKIYYGLSIAAFLALSACGGGESTTSSGASEEQEKDVTAGDDAVDAEVTASPTSGN